MGTQEELKNKLYKRINDGYYDFKMERPKGRIYKQNEILDYDLTIKQNKELIQKLNDAYTKELLTYKANQKELKIQFKEDVIFYLRAKFDSLYRSHVLKIMEYVNEQGRFNNRIEFIEEIEEVANLYCELKNLKDK